MTFSNVPSRRSRLGMNIPLPGSENSGYAAFTRCLSVIFNTFEVPERERSEVGAYHQLGTAKSWRHSRASYDVKSENPGEVPEATTAGRASSAELCSKHT
jgi:hypothetical protein